MSGISGKFVSKKIRSICWKPEQKDSFRTQNFFISGSWDDEANVIQLWSLQTGEDNNSVGNVEPISVSEKIHDGDVTDLKFVNADSFISSSSTGTVSLYKIDFNQDINCTKSWTNAHSLECTAISVFGLEFCTVGEDGMVNLYDVNAMKISQNIENADSCTITDVTYTKHDEILTTNVRGQLKLWDVRSKNKSPCRNFFMTGDQLSVFCVNCHPTQNHIVATGCEDGVLSIWDMRQDSHPVSLFNCHESGILSVKFHPTAPDNLFTSSLDGSVMHWNGSSMRFPTTGLTSNHNDFSDPIGNVWLNCDARKHKLEITSLLPQSYKPINCVDVSTDKIICGSDNEIIFVIENNVM